jgi:hypothetical protein
LFDIVPYWAVALVAVGAYFMGAFGGKKGSKRRF